MNRIKIDLPDNPYEVLLGENILYGLNEEIQKLDFYKNIFIIIDKNVSTLHSEFLNSALEDMNIVGRYEFESLESEKTFDSMQKIFNAMLDVNLSRDSVVVAIGGGIVGDVAGFVAATYMRGVQYVQVPTTLLAAVDSSVGGKTGINFHATKNVIGAFYQPKLVLIDTNFLSTLPAEEILCGMGEVVKYAYITNEELFEFVNSNLSGILELDEEPLNHVIHESVKFKGDVVRADEKESNLRKILNLGHTFAHAFEIQQNHRIKHGQAVIVGIACALYLSKSLEIMNNDEFERLMKLIEPFKPDINLEPIVTDEIKSIMIRDKKNREGRVKFVLINSVGALNVDVDAEWKDVEEAIQMGSKLFS